MGDRKHAWMVLALRARLGLNRETFARLHPVSTVDAVAGGDRGRSAGGGGCAVARGEVIGAWLVRPNEAAG